MLTMMMADWLGDQYPDDDIGEECPELRCISRISRGIAERIFCGPEWGNISFGSAPLDEPVAAQDFMDAVAEMNAYSDQDYKWMREWTFTGFWSGYENISHLAGIYSNKRYELLASWITVWVPFVGNVKPSASIDRQRLMYRWPFNCANRLGLADIVFYLNQTDFKPHSPPDNHGTGNWEVIPAEMPVIQSLYNHYGNAYAAWYKEELLCGYPVPDNPNLSPISGLSPFTLPVPIATDITDGEQCTLRGDSDHGSTITDPGTYTVTWTYTDANGSTSTQSQVVEVFVSNTPPVSDAGEDQTHASVRGTAMVTLDGYAQVRLDGTASHDENEDVLVCSWLNNDLQLMATGSVAQVRLSVGEHDIYLVAHDGFDESKSDACAVRVVEALAMGVKLTPQSLNRRTKRPVVTARVDVSGLSASALDLDAGIMLPPGNIMAEQVKLLPANGKDAPRTLMVDFDSAALLDAIGGSGHVEATIALQLVTGQ